MTTPLFMLRCVQLGISIADLDLLTIGLVNDMFTERQNDEYPYQELASQADFDRFQPNFRAYIDCKISTKVCEDKEKPRPAIARRENTVIYSPIRFQHLQNQQGHLQ